MLRKLKAFGSLYRELGLRWSAFRLAYAFRLRTGGIRLQMPKGKWDDYKNLIDNVGAPHRPEIIEGSRRPIFPIKTSIPENITWDKNKAIEEANRILSGELKYFAHEFHQVGFPPNWHQYVILSDSEGSLPRQPEILQSRKKLLQNDMNRHWSQISDDSITDIKFIWEPNRFAFVYTLVRAYAATQDEKYPQAFWSLIEDWAKHNHPNTGPNWMDGQEISLRLMAWTFGYFHFSNSPSTTPERKENFKLYVVAQAERIYKNIGYAISTRSNHTISEAFGLWMVGLLFPELKHAEKYLSLGKRLLEQEAANQIFPDGGYSMYSLNYHRFILHIYLYAIQLGELNHSPFSDDLKQSIANSITYLSSLIDPSTGQMPVYGSNDGALILPLNTCDFTDYCPLLQLGWYITKGEFLFESGPWDEDIYWICGESITAKNAKAAKEEKEKYLSALGELGGESFPNGGVYVLRSANSQAIIRCTDFTSRPSHADQLHLDLWIHGYNIAIDAGTYLYSGEGQWRNGLAHTPAHNTVIVDNKDQMTKLSRFTWTNWSKGKVLKQDNDIWQGEHDGYKPVSHKRTVMSLEDDRWLVVDNLAATESHHYALHWLFNDFDFGMRELAPAHSLWLQPFGSMLPESKFIVQLGLLEGDGEFSLVRADPMSTRGWRSRYYGDKEPAISVMLETNQPQVTFWTFFGVEGDKVELTGNVLKINSATIQL